MRKLTIISLAFNAAILAGCAATTDPAADFMAHMDSRPPDKQLPNWAWTKALMMREPPSVGGMAPDFTLKTRGSNTTTSLSQFRNEKPVVLIFGSWT